VDLLPAGMISHGLYGGSQFVQNQPNGSQNSFGILRPGGALNFRYEPAVVGAGFIACEGKRVCGATMTSDGFGRWAVPSAKDLADVFNMMMAATQNQTMYFDATVEKIFETVSALQKEVRSLKAGGAGAAPQSVPSNGGVAGGYGNLGGDYGDTIVQGKVIEGPGFRGSAPRAHSADRTAAARRGGASMFAQDMNTLDADVQELKRKFGMSPMGEAAAAPNMADSKAPMSASKWQPPETGKSGGGWDWRGKPTTPQPGMEKFALTKESAGTGPAAGDRGKPEAPSMQPAHAGPAITVSAPMAPPSRPVGSGGNSPTRPSPWSRQTSPAAPPTQETALPGARPETPVQTRPGPSATTAASATSPMSPGMAKGTGATAPSKPPVEDVMNLTAELDKCLMMRQVSAQSAGGASLSNQPLSGRPVTPGRTAQAAAMMQQQQACHAGRFKGVPQSVATKLFIK